LLDFNKQLEILVPKPEKELLQIPQAFNKTDVFPVGIYAISEDLDSKYVFADLGLARITRIQVQSDLGIEIKETSKADEAAIIETADYFQHKITVKNRAQLKALYKMLNTENIVYLILLWLSW
jgi:lipoprotein-releasing system permease protein